MEIIIVKDYEEMSHKAFEVVVDIVKKNAYAILGLATGTTPLGLYKKMIEDHKVHGTNYAHVRTVNLDEYKGLPPYHEQSYAYFMRKNLFDGLGMDSEHTYIESGIAENTQEECERYNRILKELPRDIQLLGLGSNGHIAFNEPGTPFDSLTHVVDLTDSTIKDNSRLFKDISEVPTQAYTMGIGQIMSAQKILILANGENKAKAVRAMVKGEVMEDCPASILQTHHDCTLIIDEKAASLL